MQRNVESRWLWLKFNFSFRFVLAFISQMSFAIWFTLSCNMANRYERISILNSYHLLSF
jgi:hypothetical protein